MRPFRKRKEFSTTDSELNAMAIPASHGARKPSIVAGIAIAL